MKTDSSQLVKIGQAAKTVGVSIDTLRRWERVGKINAVRTPGGTRLYSLEELKSANKSPQSPLLQEQSEIQTPLLDIEGQIDGSASIPSTKELLLKKQEPLNFSDQELIDKLKLPTQPNIGYVQFGQIEQTGKASDTLHLHKDDDSSDNTHLGSETYAKIYAKSNKGRFTTPVLASLFIIVAVLGMSTFHILSGKDNLKFLNSQLENSNVLAASSIANSGKYLEINADTILKGSLAVDGEGTFTGNVTAPNLLYGIVAGTNVSITDGQTPTLSVSLPSNLVNTVQGQTGNVSFTAGDHITISGTTISASVPSAVTYTGGTDISISNTTISDTSTLATVRSRGGCTGCITNSDIGATLLSSTGTTNYLQKVTGADILGDSVIYDDGTNVGIGTTSPSEKLVVLGNTFLGGNSNTLTTTTVLGPAVTALDTVGVIGYHAVLRLGGDGKARIAYSDSSNQSIKYIICNDVACSSPTISTANDPGSGSIDGFRRTTSLALDSSDNPYILYHHGTNDGSGGTLELARYVGGGTGNCSNTNWECTSVATPGAGGSQSIQIASDGFARIVYTDRANNDYAGDVVGALKYIQCTDADCTPGSNIVSTVDAPPGTKAGTVPSLVLDSSDIPSIVYHSDVQDFSFSGGTERFAHFVGSGGTGCSGTTAWTCKDLAAPGGTASSIQLSSDVNQYPMIAYSTGKGWNGNGTKQVAFIKCLDANCASIANGAPAIIDGPVAGNIQISLAIGSDGLPRISYFDLTNNQVKLTTCDTDDCNGTPTITVIDSTQTEPSSLALDSSNNYRIAYTKGGWPNLDLGYAYYYSNTADDFTADGNDLFVAGQIGVQDGIVTGGAISSQFNQNLLLTPGGAGGVQITSSAITGTGTASALSLTADSVTTGTVFDISASSLTTGTVQNITANSLTTGTALLVSSTSNFSSSGKLANFTNNTTADGTLVNISGNGLTTGVALEVSSTSSLSSSGKLVDITDNTTTEGTLLNISASALTTGTALNVGTSSTSYGVALNVSSGAVSFANAGTATAGSIADNIIFHLSFDKTLTSDEGDQAYWGGNTDTEAVATYIDDQGKLQVVANPADPRFNRVIDPVNHKAPAGYAWVAEGDYNTNLAPYSSFENVDTGWSTQDGSLVRTFVQAGDSGNATNMVPMHGNYVAKLVNSSSSPKFYYFPVTGVTSWYAVNYYLFRGTSGNVGGTVNTGVTDGFFTADNTFATGIPECTQQGCQIAKVTDSGWYRVLSAANLNNNGTWYVGVRVGGNETVYLDAIGVQQGLGNSGSTPSPSYVLTTDATPKTHRSEGIPRYQTANNFNKDEGTISVWKRSGVNCDIHLLRDTGNSWDFIASYCSSSYFTPDAGTHSVTGPATCGDGSGSAGYDYKWHHWVVTWDKNSMYIYCDGKPGAAGTPPANYTAPASEFYIGHHQGQGNYGEMADFAILNRALTPAEVRQIYESKAPINSSSANQYARLQQPILGNILSQTGGLFLSSAATTQTANLLTSATTGVTLQVNNSGTGLAVSAGGSVASAGTLFANSIDSPDIISPQSLRGQADGSHWSEVGSNSLPVGVMWHTSLVYNGKMWVLGGYDGSGDRDEVYSSSDGITWTEVGSLPITEEFASSVVFNGKMWVMGGADGGGNRKAYYSTDGATWAVATRGEAETDTLPVRTGAQSSVVFNNKMWLLGGFVDLSGDTDAVYSSPDGINWTEVGSLPVTSEVASAVVFNNKMWLIGGYQNGTAGRKVYYTSDGITWTEAGTNALPVALSLHQSVVFNGKMWVIGGVTGGNTTSEKVYYSTNGSTWTEAGTDVLPTLGMDSHTALVYNGKMWAIGGEDDNGDPIQKVYSTDNGLEGDLFIAGDITPSVDNTYSLGSADLRWKDIFIGPGSLHLSSTTGTSGPGDDYTAGTLEFSGNNLKLSTLAVGAGETGTIQVTTGSNDGITVDEDGNTFIGGDSDTLTTTTVLGPAVTPIDSTGDVGIGSSIAIGSNGLARISYIDSSNSALKYITCNDAVCSIPSVSTVDNIPAIGEGSAIALDDSNTPYILYHYSDGTHSQNGGSLHMARYVGGGLGVGCTNSDWSCTEVASPGGHSNFLLTPGSIKIGSDGLPRVAYSDSIWDDHGYLKYIQCTDADCTPGSNIVFAVDSPVPDEKAGIGAMLALGSGDVPFISYHYGTFDGSGGKLMLAHYVGIGGTGCHGSTDWTCTPVATPGGPKSSLQLGSDDGFPRIAYYTNFNGSKELDFVKCLDANCASIANGSPATIDATARAGEFGLSMAIGSDGNAKIAYYDDSTGDLKLAECSDDDCTGSITTSTLDSTGDVGKTVSLALNSNDNYKISYYDDTNGNLKYAYYYTISNNEFVTDGNDLFVAGQIGVKDGIVTGGAITTQQDQNLLLSPAGISGVQITSGAIEGAGTSSALSLTADSVTTGTVFDISAAGLTSGTVQNIAADSLTTGTVLNISAAGLTTGKLFNITDKAISTSITPNSLTLTDRDLTVGGHTDKTTQANILQVFVYDTTKDPDGGAWTDNDRARASSWYNEELNDANRGTARPFPKKAIIVLQTNGGWTIYDAKDNSLWMFKDGNNTSVSSMYMYNGKLYVENNVGTSASTVEYDFINDKVFVWDGSLHVATSSTGIASRDNVAIGIRIIQTVPNLNINGKSTAMHAQVVNGKTYFVTAPGDDGIIVVNETDEKSIQYGDNINDHYKAVWLDKEGNLWALNQTRSQLEKWNKVVNDTANEHAGTPDSVWTASSTPALANAALAIQSLSQQDLYVTDGTSTADGKSQTVYVGTDKGVAILNTNKADETKGSVKYVTKDWITEEMYGDIKGMWHLTDNAASATVDDASLKANNLTLYADSSGTPSTTANTSTVTTSGVRGKGFNFNGSSNFLYRTDDDFNFTSEDFTISMWVNPDSFTSNSRTLLSYGDNATTGYELVLNRFDDDFATIAFKTYQAGPASQTTSASSINVMTGPCQCSQMGTGWFHIAVVRSGASVRIFVAGHDDTATAGTHTDPDTAAGSNLVIGAKQNGASQWFDGQIDDVMITGQALNPTQLRKLYEVGFSAVHNHDTENDTDLDGSVDNDTLQNLYGTTNTTRSLSVDESHSYLVVGTNDGSDGGGVSVIGLNTDTREEVYSNDNATANKDTDSETDPLTSDDWMSVSIAGNYKPNTRPGYSLGGTLAIGNDAEFYVENTDVSFQDFIANANNPFGPTLFQTNISVGSTFAVGSNWLAANTATGVRSGDKILNAALSVNASGDVIIGANNNETNGAASTDKSNRLAFNALESGILKTAYLWFDTDASDSLNSTVAITTTAQSYDLAEDYKVRDEAIEPGDLVVIDKEASASATVAKSSTKYQNDILGIVSEAPGFRLSQADKNNYRPVALAGRVAVKVSSENGAIKKGDYLTSSSTPGVAMKATRPGQVVGKALEDFTPSCGEIDNQFCKGKVLTFVNVSFADPQNALANLLLDIDGSLIIPKIKTASLSLGPITEASNSAVLGANTSTLIYQSANTPIDIAATLKTVDEKLATQSAQLANVAEKQASDSAKTKSLAEELASASAIIAQSRSDLDTLKLKLEAPESLMATNSAQIAEAKVEHLEVSEIFKSLGNTFLGNTIIAGDFSIDGTFSISQNTINAIGLPNIDSAADGILFLQQNVLAKGLDILNGRFTFDRNGKLAVNGEVEAQKFTVQTNGGENQTAGSSTLPANQTKLVINNTLVKASSIIILTPKQTSNQSMAVTSRIENKSFTVEVENSSSTDISFDYLIVGVNDKKDQSVDH
jgi:hypothetical protein